MLSCSVNPQILRSKSVQKGKGFVLRKSVTAVNIKSVQRKLSRYKFIMFSGSVNPQILRSKSVQKGKEVPLSALRSSTFVRNVVRCFTKEQQIQAYDQRRVSYPMHISILYIRKL